MKSTDGQKYRHAGLHTDQSRVSWPHTSRPSPHEILGVRAGEAYTKDAFRKLAKLYHPDLARHNDTSLGGIDRTTCLHRFRLVMEAHEILNDPHKRMMFEKYGVGWVFPQAPTTKSRPSQRYENSAFDEGQRSHERRAHGAKQVAIFTSNATFVMLLLAFAMACSIIQLERVRRDRIGSQATDAALQESLQRDLMHVAHRLEGKSKELLILAFLARRRAGDRVENDVAAFPMDLEDNICRH